MVANGQIENLGSIQQYRDEQHRASLADLEHKINVACVEDDIGKAQLSVDLRESLRAFGELQGELTSKVRQLDLVQTEFKRVTDSRGAVGVERERLEHQVVQYQEEIQRLDQINVAVENDKRAMVFDEVNKQHDFDAFKDGGLKLKETVSQLGTSVRELSQKAGAPDSDANSVVAKSSSEVIKAKAENASQQDIFSRKIDEMARASDEKILRYTTQIGALRGEVLRLQSQSENKSEARSGPNEILPNPKSEVFSLLQLLGRCRPVLFMLSSAPSNEWANGSPVSPIGLTNLTKEPLAVVPVRNQQEVDRRLGELLRNTPLGNPLPGITIPLKANIVRTVISPKGNLQATLMIPLVRRTEIK